MKNISFFQIGVYIACAVGIIVAVVLFARTSSQGGSDRITGSITIWGTLPSVGMNTVTESIRQTYKDVTVSYVEKTQAQFQNDLVNALASGLGPDIILTEPEYLIANQDRILIVPFTSLPEPVYRATFIDHADIYITNQGISAFPFTIDPLVMFVNKDMLNSAFVAKAPETWEDISRLNRLLTQKDDAGNLSQQTIALGTFDNIRRAKELLLMLMAQVGNKLVAFEPGTNRYRSAFADNGSQGISNSQVFAFYTSFANSTDNDRYSWNRALPQDANQFISGRLALYFDMASSIESVRLRNPNLNFGVEMVPQRQGQALKATYGRMIGVSVLKSSKNPQLAFLVAQNIASKETVESYLSAYPFLAPARRDMLAMIPSDNQVRAMIYRSAIISRGFLDPDTSRTTGFMRNMVDRINAGSLSSESVITSGNALLNDILTSVQR